MTAIRLASDPALHTVCRAWDFAADGDPVPLLIDLTKTAQAAGNALGLSAPQIGRLVRVFVMRQGDAWLRCINPSFVGGPELRSGAEGCLSFPGLYIQVRRHAVVQASWFDALGRAHTGGLSGMEARCFQHECDHLDGKTMVDGRSVAVAMARKKASRAR